MYAVWTNLTDGQGAVLAALITLIAALGGVVIGWLLFSRKITTLQQALDHSATKVESHVNRSELTVANHLKSVESSFKSFEEVATEQLTSLAAQLSRVNAIVADMPTSLPGNEPQAPAGAVEAESKLPLANYRDQILESWTKIRDRIEAIASDPSVDGRTIAKYGRIDRRQYLDLVANLEADGRLGRNAALYKEAIELWQRYRANRATPSKGDVQAMKDLAKRLLS